MQRWPVVHTSDSQKAADLAFPQALLESLPGVLYLYDNDGRFLRWNSAFARLSGYGDDEIRGMRPSDFFAAEDRAQLARRIGEVFETGSSTLEADLVAKDGTRRPMLFTGQRLLLGGAPCLVGVGLDLSERIAAQRALQRLEQRHRATLDHIMEGCQIIDFDTRYLYLNEAAATHNRRPNAELLGQTMPAAWPGIEQTTVFQMIARSLRERVALHDEVEFVFADGARGWFDIAISPVDEGAFVLSIDITARREAELARAQLFDRERAARIEAEAAHRQVDLILASVTDGWLSLDASGRCTYMNARASRIFDVEREAILGEIFWSNQTEIEALRAACDEARRSAQMTQIEELRGGRWLEHRCYPSEGGVSVVIHDVTVRKEAEAAQRRAHDELERRVVERTRELEAAKVRAEAADRLKSAFLATMSHELRTPLNSILGFTGLLLQELPGPLGDEQKKQLGMVQGSARHLLELINDVLDISRIEAGQLEVVAAPFDIGASLERVVAAARPFADKKGLRLGVRRPETLPEVTSDRRRVEQILINLLNNAIKFTDRGGVDLVVGVVDDALVFDVEDSGIGIDERDVATLFAPFHQLDTGLTRQRDGTGLGLAICRRLAGLLGGTVGLSRSAAGAGSTFTFRLPLATKGSP